MKAGRWVERSVGWSAPRKAGCSVDQRADWMAGLLAALSVRLLVASKADWWALRWAELRAEQRADQMDAN